MEQKTRFTSKIGMIAAAAGSAVGLGNIWRFPSETADGGGAIFILVFLVCVLFFGVPLMMAEFIIGRSTHTNTAGAYRKLSDQKGWIWIGRLGVLTGFVIMGFYLVVCGWTLEYVWQSITGKLSSVNDYAANFNRLLDNPFRQVLLMVIFTVMTAYFIISGVKRGIERSAKIFMPILFIFLIVLALRSITLVGASEGLSFLFRPNLDNVKSTVFLDAMGQAFFSLSIGMGCMTTYASYFKDDANLGKSAFQVSILDSLVAILAGVVIFPAAFALTTNTDKVVGELIAGGPGLLFISIPQLFSNMAFSSLWASLFFMLLCIAALTSTISLMEVVTLYIHEEFGLSRTKSTVWIAICVMILGTIASFSGTFFNLLDFASAKIMLPVGGFFISVFVGWYLDKSLIQAQISNSGTLRIPASFIKVYIFVLKYVAPLAILAIFLYGFLG